MAKRKGGKRRHGRVRTRGCDRRFPLAVLKSRIRRIRAALKWTPEQRDAQGYPSTASELRIYLREHEQGLRERSRRPRRKNPVRTRRPKWLTRRRGAEFARFARKVWRKRKGKSKKELETMIRREWRKIRKKKALFWAEQDRYLNS